MLFWRIWSSSRALASLCRCNSDKSSSTVGGGGLDEALFNGSFFHKAIADAANSVEIFRAGAELLAEPAHVGVHSAGIDQIVILPNVLQQLLARLHAAAPLYENSQ